jgi:poly(hydroxyalkanoate) granule-associated protein
MANKAKATTKTTAKASAKSDEKLVESVRASAQQIWQAGLGAFAKAQAEGGKVFAKLVKEGTDLHKLTQKLTEDKVGSVSKLADNVSKQAADSWDKLEQVFEDRVSRALTRLGVPSSKDIDALNARVAELDKLLKAQAGKRPASASAARKPASKVSTPSVAKPAAKPKRKPAIKPAAKKPRARPAGAAR